MWSSARCRHNPDASLARIGNLLAVGRPIQAGFSALSAGEQNGPSATRRKEDNLAGTSQSDGLAVRRECIVADRLEGEQILKRETSARLRVKSKREQEDEGGDRGTAEESTKNVHFFLFLVFKVVMDAGTGLDGPCPQSKGFQYSY